MGSQSRSLTESLTESTTKSISESVIESMSREDRKVIVTNRARHIFLGREDIKKEG